MKKQRLSADDLRELAMCCRIGAVQARKDAEAQGHNTTGEIHRATAAKREELARRMDALAAERDNGG